MQHALIDLNASYILSYGGIASDPVTNANVYKTSDAYNMASSAWAGADNLYGTASGTYAVSYGAVARADRDIGSALPQVTYIFGA